MAGSVKERAEKGFLFVRIDEVLFSDGPGEVTFFRLKRIVTVFMKLVEFSTSAYISLTVVKTSKSVGSDSV